MFRMGGSALLFICPKDRVVTGDHDRSPALMNFTPPSSLAKEVSQLEKLLGKAYAGMLTDDVVYQLKSVKVGFVQSALGVLSHRMKKSSKHAQRSSLARSIYCVPTPTTPGSSSVRFFSTRIMHQGRVETILVPSRLAMEVLEHLEKLLGKVSPDMLTDDVVSDLKSEDVIDVNGALRELSVRMKKPIDGSALKTCAKTIAALNVPKTFLEIIDGFVFTSFPKTNKYCKDAVNVILKSTPIFITNTTKLENTRVSCVTAVVGPSGSGKTAFSIQYLTAELKAKAKVSGRIMFTYHTNYNRVKELDANEVYRKALDHCDEKGVTKPDGNDFLKDMYLHVIVDECDMFPSMSDEEFKDWRRKRIDHFLGRFAGVHITLAGTMLDVRMAAVGSESEGFAKIRLQPWTTTHFEAFLKDIIDGSNKDTHKKGSDKLVSPPRSDKLATLDKFVKQSPLLMSLTSNARAAVFLVDAINDRLHLGSVCASTSSILDLVVFTYLRSNGLSLYTATEGACVGLSALRCALGLHINADSPNVPSAIEQHCIQRGILTWNIEITKDGDYRRVNNRPRIEMQPALVIVCLVLCGLLPSSQQIEGWSGVELIAALWAACSIPYSAVEIKSDNTKRLVATGKSSTPRIHLSANAFGLETQTKQLLFADIPLDQVPTTAVINADKGHGMDVVGPWLLIQAKHNVSLGSPYNVNVMDELNKAGLFDGSPLTPLTEALLLAWKKVPISTPPAVLAPLSHLLEYIPRGRWDNKIAVVKGKLVNIVHKLGTNNPKPASATLSSQSCVQTRLAVDPVPKGSVRVVLLLFGHSFLLRTSGPDGSRSPQLLVKESGGCVRLLAAKGNKVTANKAAVPDGDTEAQDALATLADAVADANPAVDFVLDVVYQPLQESTPCALRPVS